MSWTNFYPVLLALLKKTRVYLIKVPTIGKNKLNSRFVVGRAVKVKAVELEVGAKVPPGKVM